MKITSFFLLICCLQLSARTLSQTITFSGNNVPIQQVFTAIKSQTGFVIVGNMELLNQATPVTITVQEMPLEKFLRLLFQKQPLSYIIKEQTIVLQVKPTADLQSAGISSPPPPIDIHGHVTDSLGKPLVGASVTVKGSRKGATTDAQGNFTLTGVKDNAIILVSYTGFETRQIALASNPGLKSGVDISGVPFTLTLIRSISSLDQVQVIAYGTTTQRLNTGDVTTITSKEIEEQPVNNPLLALEGRVPGLFITQSTGLPGSGVTVQIQGQNSIQNGNDPFYVIDGVPYTSQLLPNISGILGTSGFATFASPSGSGNPLSYINPSDIESISVLKDASATAIYGSRAANGAIFITTKKGKAGQTKVDINLQNGWGQVTRKLDLLNTQQYLQMRYEALNNDGITPSIANGDYDLLQWDTTRYTDWQKTLIGGTAQYTNLSATLSGGNSITQYLVGGTYHKEGTVFPGSFSDQKASLHFNINSVSSNQKLRFQLSGNYLVDNNQLPGVDLTNTAITLAPDAPPIYNSNGSLNWANSTWSNPLAYLSNKYNSRTNNLISNAVISYQLFPGFNIKSDFGYTNMQTTETNLLPLVYFNPTRWSYVQRSASYANNNISSWIIEPQATYTRTLGKGKLEGLVGSTIQQNVSNGQILNGTGYNSDLVLADIRSASMVSVGSDVASVYKYNALFGRLNYDWADKYLINLTIRRDGSSRFGSANQFHDYGAVGIGWIFSQEPIIKQKIPILSFGKLRASYGTTGSDQIGNYQFLNLYSPTSVGVPYQGVSGLQPNGIANPYLEWEETKKLQFGLELGVLNDRILFTTNYNLNRSSNQLLEYLLPIITGVAGITKNFPATVENSGLEFSFNTTNVKSKSFSWKSNLILTIPINKLVAFPNLATSVYASTLVIGQPISIIKVFQFLGVDPTTGVYKFTSKTDPFNPAFPDDAIALTNTSPKFHGGFQNSFQYKGFELDVFFQFVKQIGANYEFGYYPGIEGSNQPVSVLSRWQKPGDITNIQKYNSNYSLGSQFFYASAQSDAALSDASYIRLKNLSLSWNLPDLLMKKSHLQSVRLYIQAQNLMTITKYKGVDPKNVSTNSLPPLRVLTSGIQIGL